MGFHIKTIEPVELKKGKMFVNIGKLVLQPELIEMKGMKVVEEKSPIEFKIDKKVVNVSKEYTTVSGSAVDVLQNVPSVDVDIEGNVSLRGSKSFTVLINNRPTVLEPNEALQQIPASIIDKIEIITTKKKRLPGTSGIGNVNVGLNDKYGGDFLLNFRRSKFNFYLGIDYNKKNFPGTIESENQTKMGDTTSFVKSSGTSNWQWKGYGARGGIDFNIGKNDLLSVLSRYGTRNMHRNSDANFDEWTEPETLHNLYTNNSDWQMVGNFYSADMNYKHTFSENHELSSAFYFGHRKG
ncbi:MAG: hypothetical protein B5M53_01240, partial [Candidatus Cloacimonas sp. 4484_209]